MPGIIMGEITGEIALNGNNAPVKRNSGLNKSRSSSGRRSPRVEGLEPPLDGAVEASIDQLYENVCDLQSSGPSSSRHSFASIGEESRIDLELRNLVGGEMREVEIMKDEVNKLEVDSPSTSSSKSGSSAGTRKAGKSDKSQAPIARSSSLGQRRKTSDLQLDLAASSKAGLTGSSPTNKPPLDTRNGKTPKKSSSGASSMKKAKSFKLQNGNEDALESGLNNPDLGPFLLKQARDLISSGDNPDKALEFALRAAKSFEFCANGKPSLDRVMSLHVIAAIYCSMGRYNEAIPVLEESVGIPVIEEGQEHALAKFASHMQLGDTYAVLGQLENSIACYKTGLEVQKLVLGETDPRVGETCRYLSEAYVQALHFDEAEQLCRMALDIHKANGSPASLEEAADRRLMGLICETKGDHEAALEHFVLASMAMVANGQEAEVASVDCSIGDTYLSLSRYDEAIFAYQKALTTFKATKGEGHPAVGSVFIRLADLYNRTGKLRDSKSYCENALTIYEKPTPGVPREEIASGLADISTIYESMNELDQAIKMLQKALKLYNDAPGQQSTVAGIEAQVGVMYYMLGNYSEAYNSLKSAISKLRACGEKKSAFFGIALNQLGLACVQRYAITEAVDLFEEARTVLEQEYGPYHSETLAVYSNLAGAYDAIGRLDDAIELLEHVVAIREEKLGTANPDVYDEKRRLAQLLKDAGRARSRKAASLETLLGSDSMFLNLDAAEA